MSEEDKSNELNHLSINYEELVREHGRLSRTLGVTAQELEVQCEHILQVIGNISRTGVADIKEVAQKAGYWHNMREAYGRGESPPVEEPSARPRATGFTEPMAHFTISEEEARANTYSTLSGEKPTVAELNRVVGDNEVSLDGITARVMHNNQGRIIAFMLGPNSTKEQAMQFQRALIDDARKSTAETNHVTIDQLNLPSTPSAIEWEEQMELYVEVRNRIVRALTMRNLSVPRYEVDETHTIRLWVETEGFNQAPNVFTTINNVLREYPSHEPRVVCWVKHIKIERTETDSVFTVGG